MIGAIGRRGHSDGGPCRTLDEQDLRAQREWWHGQPQSPERARALLKIRRQLGKIEYRSPWKPE